MTAKREIGFTLHKKNDVQVATFPNRHMVAQLPPVLHSTTKDSIREKSQFAFGPWVDRESPVDAFLHDLRTGRPSEELKDMYTKMKVELGTKIRAKLPEIPLARRKRVISDDGDSINIDRFLERDTDCWESMTKVSGRKRFITIGISIIGSCVQQEEEFARNICAAVTVAEQFRAKGYSVRIVGISTVGPGWISWMKSRKVKEFGFIWPLVDYGDQFSPKALLNWGTSPMTRFLSFAWWDTIWPEVKEWSSRGTCQNPTKETLELAKVDMCLHMRLPGDDTAFVAKVSKMAEGVVKTLGAKRSK